MAPVRKDKPNAIQQTVLQPPLRRIQQAATRRPPSKRDAYEVRPQRTAALADRYTGAVRGAQRKTATARKLIKQRKWDAAGQALAGSRRDLSEARQGAQQLRRADRKLDRMVRNDPFHLGTIRSSAEVKHPAQTSRTTLRRTSQEIAATGRQLDRLKPKHQVYGDIHDADFDKGLLRRLQKVSKDLGQPLYVREGSRSYKEQAALYAKYGPGQAAPPGTSNHEDGNAADVAVGRSSAGPNLGSYPGGFQAANRAGLNFTVPGEDWHVEVGGGNAWQPGQPTL